MLHENADVYSMLQGATCKNIIHFSRFVEDKVFTVEKHTSVDETVLYVQKGSFFSQIF